MISEEKFAEQWSDLVSLLEKIPPDKLEVVKEIMDTVTSGKDLLDKGNVLDAVTKCIFPILTLLLIRFFDDFAHENSTSIDPELIAVVAQYLEDKKLNSGVKST